MSWYLAAKFLSCQQYQKHSDLQLSLHFQLDNLNAEGVVNINIDLIMHTMSLKANRQTFPSQ